MNETAAVSSTQITEFIPMDSTRPPRPGNPDGTVIEQLQYWVGFGLWIAFLLIGYVVSQLYDWIQSGKSKSG